MDGDKELCHRPGLLARAVPSIRWRTCRHRRAHVKLSEPAAVLTPHRHRQPARSVTGADELGQRQYAPAVATRAVPANGSDHPQFIASLALAKIRFRGQTTRCSWCLGLVSAVTSCADAALVTEVKYTEVEYEKGCARGCSRAARR
jgi:hypothetical protein